MSLKPSFPPPNPNPFLAAALCAGFLLSGPSLVRAGSTLEASTVFGAWSWEGETEEEEGDTASQYLRLGSSGKWGDLGYSFEGYGRASLTEESLSGDAADEARDTSRLYGLTLSLDKGSASLSLGRQMLFPCSGPLTLDGAVFTWSAPDWSLGFRYGWEADVADGGSGGARVLGVGGDYTLLKGMDLALDYARTFSEGSLLAEEFAADWSYRWFRRTDVFLDFDWDLMSKTFSEVEMGMAIPFSDRLSLEIAQGQTLPTFDSDSIYSVFAVTPSEYTRFLFLFDPQPRLRYTWEYALESYGGGEGGRRYQFGARWSPGEARLTGDLAQHKGSGGESTEFGFSASFPLLPRLRLGTGGEFARSQADGEEEAASYDWHLGAEWETGKGSRLTLRGDRAGDDRGGGDGWSARLSWDMAF